MPPWSRRVQPTQPAARLLSRADGGTQRRPPAARCREETRAGDLGVKGGGVTRTQRWRRQRPAAPGRSAPPAEHRHTGAEPSGAHLPRPGGSCATPPLRAKEQGGPALKAQGQDWGARGGGRWPAAPWGSERQRPRGGEGDAPSPELRWGPRGAEETLRGEGRVSPGPPPPLPAGAPHKLIHRRPLLQPSAHFGSTGFEQATHAV